MAKGSKAADVSAAIEELIASAMDGAKRLEGSNPGLQPGDSQTFHFLLHECVKSWRQGLEDKPRLADVGNLVTAVLEICGNDHCRPQPMANRRSMFPLFAPGQSVDAGPTSSFLPALIASLNHLHGVEMTGRRTQTSSRAEKRLAKLVQDSGLLAEFLPPLCFEDFFSCRQLDYVGEEVHVARGVVWESIEASLPAQVGQLDIRDFTEGGVRFYIDHLEDFVEVPQGFQLGKPPRVFVEDQHWDAVARGLVNRGLCHVLRRSELFHVGSQPLWNGFFSIGKQEYVGNIESCRLIMNLKPFNSLCLPMTGDTATLPMISNLGTMFLDHNEVLCISSEDIRCFFYLFRVPQAWWRFMSFGRVAPASVTPAEFGNEEGYLASTVLPMGWINSVALAQHIHRRVVRRSMGSLLPPVGGECELRRDRTFSNSPHLFRVYLDNFDELKKVDRNLADAISGSPSEAVVALREAYSRDGLPRHPRKSTQQELCAEVQGAWVDGHRGIVSAKPAKVARYVSLVLELLERGSTTQRELQVVGGGLVYMCMFKRPLLCSLNQIWKSIVDLESRNKARVPLSRQVAAELARFLGLVPLAFMNLRCPFSEVVTASDASTSGGGVCASKSLSPYGLVASQSAVRGELPEPDDFSQILSVGLFDGIGALRVALDCLEVPVVGHIAVEKSAEAQRVLESYFPDIIQVDDVADVTEELVRRWALAYPSVGLVLIGAGPPCQGVSGLNSDRKGALKDCRSNLFTHVPRITQLFRVCFPWAQVHRLMESVASMDAQDCWTMSEEVGELPWYLDACGVTLCHRPRLYWITWELLQGDGVAFGYGSEGALPLQGEVSLEAQLDGTLYLESGWSMHEHRRLPTFTTSRPSFAPLKRPAGLRSCAPHELLRWREDLHRFPPYQYKDENCLFSAAGEFRVPSVPEREVILGFPRDYTSQCMPKKDHGTARHNDNRLSLLGNTWCVPVVAWLISNLLVILGFLEKLSPQDIVNRLKPGQGRTLQGLLLRPPIRGSTSSYPSSAGLVQKLSNLVSLKGEDLLLQAPTESPVKFHRLRTSVPAGLWRWKTIAGWQWTGAQEHINVLELRSVLTTIKYRAEQLGDMDVRCVHLVDSLVVLHALTRGRTSSRKMRRTLMRVNSYLLASGLQLCWGYVDTHQNPADRPSRRGAKRKWVRKLRK